MITHRAAMNTIIDVNRRFEIRQQDRFFALSSLSFDLSVYDIFGALSAGAAIVIPSPASAPTPGYWLSLADERGVTIWNSVPALLEMAVAHLEQTKGPGPASLRLGLLSGDWIPISLPARVHRCLPGCALVGLGGATEASIWSNFHGIETVDPSWKSIPYGRPLRNQEFHILDGDMKACPHGARGELYIGGRGVALGYWRDPKRTAASFVPYPETGQRLYRTGDHGRLMPNGEIEFLGRVDTQVKIRGYRVELGEIEATLALHPGVQCAVATVDRRDSTDGRLVAYVVAKPGCNITGDDLRKHLAGFVPIYMVPSVIHLIRAIPLSSNGKIDRKAVSVLGNTTSDDLQAALDEIESVSEA
jgi:amino acid adenylation domain-containing protein